MKLHPTHPTRHTAPTSQLLLEAPDDIYCLRFNPTLCGLVAGGCVNGQVVLWNISPHHSRLAGRKGSAGGGGAEKVSVESPLRWSSPPHRYPLNGTGASLPLRQGTKLQSQT